MKPEHKDIFGFAGVGLISAGVGAVYLPAGFIVLGAFFVAIALLSGPITNKKDGKE